MNRKNQINILSFSVISIFFFFFFLFPSNLTLDIFYPLCLSYFVFFFILSPFSLLLLFFLSLSYPHSLLTPTPSLSLISLSYFHILFILSSSSFLHFSLFFFFLVYYSYAFLPYTFSSHSSLSIFSSPTPYHSKPPLMSSPFLHSPSPTISLTLSPPHTHYQHIHALLPHSTPPFSLELSTFFSCVGLIFFSGSCQAISD